MQAKDQEFVLQVVKQVEKELIVNGCMTTAMYLQLLECEKLLLTKSGRKSKVKEESEVK